jgi:hypothetical protein
MRDPSSHCRRDPQCLVNANEVVMHVVQADRVSVVLDFLAECIRQSREPPHAHSHGEVLALDVARRNVPRIRVAGATERLASLYLCRAVAARGMRSLAVELDQLGVVNIGTETGLDRFKIGPVPVARDLDSVREPLREIADKFDGGCAAPIADAPGRNQFRIGADRNPRPNVAGSLRGCLGEHDVALLGIDKAPNLIKLDALAGQVAERLILIGGTRLARIDRQFVDGIDRNVCDAARGTKAHAFDEAIEDFGALGDRQPVHTSQYNDVCDIGQASIHFAGRFFHRDLAATRAISLRFSGAKRSARTLPPRKPPSRPRATACGFFSISVVGSSSASPTDISTIRLASWFMSRGRAGRFGSIPGIW